MKHIMIAVICVSFYFSANAQDLIVTSKGDSINCKIDTATSEYLFFNFENSDARVPFTQLPLDQVTVYIREYYPKDISSSGLLPNMENQKNFWLSFGVGRSYRFGEIDPQLSYPMRAYTEKLKRGTVLGINAIYFIGYSSGLGLNYSRFITSNSLEDTQLFNIVGEEVTGNVADNIAISYIGPSYAARLNSLDKKHSLTGCFGIGFMKYCDVGEYVANFSITGQSVGVLLDVGYNYNISENIAFGIQTSFLGGTLTNYELEYGGRNRTVSLEEDKYESLGRADFSIRLTIKL